MNKQDVFVLQFLHVVEQLKDELRHSWTSKGRQESVAEHTWRLCVMLVICAPYLEKKIDLLQALKIAIFHDISEVKAGDKHYLQVAKTEKSRRKRFRSEAQAAYELSSLLEAKKSSIFELWKEFENKSSYEAEVVYFFDKLEACIQHNEADISTWTESEIVSIKKYYNQIKIKDSFLMKLKEAIQVESEIKIKNIANKP